MASSAAPFPYQYTPPILGNRRHNSQMSSSYSSNPCSPSPNSSCPNYSYRCPGPVCNIITFSAVKNSLRATQGNLASPRDIVKMEDQPDHLLVLVHGILASPSDWTYFEAELKGRVGKKFLIYASSCNMYTKTFTGIDGAGKRLADEVTRVVKKTENLKKISFLAHSLGGLFARYAIGVLYSPSASSDQSYDTGGSTATDYKTFYGSNKGLIAGLEAINFITLATPHLGVRGNKQVFGADNDSNS